MPRTPEQQVVPEAILRELRELEASVESSSRLDGRRRSSLPLSAASLPAPLPPHELEPGLPSLDAHVRPQEATGKAACKWLRKLGRVPGRIYSLPAAAAAAPAAAATGPAAEGPEQQPGRGRMQERPPPPAAGPGAARGAGGGSGGRGGGSGSGGGSGWRSGEVLLHFDERDVAKMVRTFGRNGCAARVLQVNVLAPPTTTITATTAATDAPPPSPPPATTSGGAAPTDAAGGGAAGSPTPQLLGAVRVKPLRVYMNAVSQRIEGLDLLYCPQDRVVQVDVPVRLVNDDQAPGVRKGGWMAVFKRTVRYKALGSCIPPYIEVNVRHLDLEQDLLVRDLPIPPGTKIHEKDFNAPVLRCTTDVGKD